MTEKYRAYLLSDEWREKRDERIKMDGNKCAVCESKKNLNVHHLTYKNITRENVEKDLITLCHRCHATLHRIQSELDPEYAKNQDEQTISGGVVIRSMIIRLITVEIWQRDISNGGDLKIFDSSMRTARALTHVLGMLYPRNLLVGVSDAVASELSLVRACMIVQRYRESHSVNTVAEQMRMKPQNVTKILKRHGFNATASIK